MHKTTIKALSLWNPWALLVSLGKKRFETRSWSTAYRGPLLICAAKKWTPILAAISEKEPFASALGFPQERLLHLGQALCIVELGDVFTAPSTAHIVSDSERAFGDFSHGRYAWHLTHLRPITPFPITGRQGLFNVEIDSALLAGG